MRHIGNIDLFGDLRVGGLVDGGLSVKDDVKAEAFYLTQGGEVFAYSFNREYFYVTPAKTNAGRYVVNLDTDPVTSVGTGTALTVADQAAPTFTNVSKITFDSNFYLAPDSTGQPVVNLVPTSFSGALVVITTDDTLVDNAALSTVTWDAVQYEIGADWFDSANPTRLTVPAGVSFISLDTCISITPIGTPAIDSRVTMRFLKNGAVIDTTDLLYRVQGIGAIISINCDYHSPVLPVIPGDYFEMQVAINEYNGNADLDSANNRTYFAIRKIG